jgi:tRNA pseudouridine55 synthase
MTGVLLVDKPAGPTSHDVVARLRRSSGERRIGHAGTLDPRATGLLVLLFGQATRLASLFSAAEKEYDATIRFGWFTDTDDADGAPMAAPSSARPTDAELAGALAAFTGTFEQTPPQYSARKLAGRRAYDLARRGRDVALAPSVVTVSRLALTGRTADTASVRLTASAGFYVRTLARDLGRRLGCGAHLEALRRVRSGRFGVDRALPLADAERLGTAVEARLIGPAEALGDLGAVELTEAGLKRALHGNPVGPEHVAGPGALPGPAPGPVRLLSADGRLVGLARPRGGALHPVVVLGYD